MPLTTLDRAISTNPLSQPVGMLARGAVPVPEEDSLAIAGRRLRESGAGVVGLIREGRYVGAVTERSLAAALASGAEPGASAAVARDAAELRIAPYVTGAEVLRLLNDLQIPALVVVDDADRLLGVISASDLLPRRLPPPRPPTIGGMATPFGVYLTTGVVRAGPGDLGLIVTGMLLFALLTLASLPADYVQEAMMRVGYREAAANTVAEAVLLLLFALLMRIVPISRTHAAEHQVVHAIERGEELTPEIVRRMPRVHPRCGTNLAVGASLFLGIATNRLLIPDETTRLLTALVLTLLLWRRLGSLVQQYITTAPAHERHIQMGIRSGEELLRKYVQAPVVSASFPRKILNSGMLHVMAGSLLCSGLVYLVARAFGYDL